MSRLRHSLGHIVIIQVASVTKLRLSTAGFTVEILDVATGTKSTTRSE
jgi:hypothetical protein